MSTSTFIVVMRNPSNKQLLALLSGEELAEYLSWTAADKAAQANMLCAAYGYDVLEVLV